MSNKTPTEEIEILKDRVNTQWKVIGVFVTIFAIGIGWLWTNDARREGEINTINTSQTQIQIQLAEIQNDISWIRKELDKENNLTYNDSIITKN